MLLKQCHVERFLQHICGQQIRLRNSAVWSGPLLSAYRICRYCRMCWWMEKSWKDCADVQDGLNLCLSHILEDYLFAWLVPLCIVESPKRVFTTSAGFIGACRCACINWHVPIADLTSTKRCFITWQLVLNFSLRLYSRVQNMVCTGIICPCSKGWSEII